MTTGAPFHFASLTTVLVIAVVAVVRVVDVGGGVAVVAVRAGVGVGELPCGKFMPSLRLVYLSLAEDSFVSLSFFCLCRYVSLSCSRSVLSLSVYSSCLSFPQPNYPSGESGSESRGDRRENRGDSGHNWKEAGVAYGRGWMKERWR